LPFYIHRDLLLNIQANKKLEKDDLLVCLPHNLADDVTEFAKNETKIRML